MSVRSVQRRSANRIAVPVAAIALATLTACGGKSTSMTTSDGSPADFPVTVSSCGRDVTFAEPPERVVTAGSVAAPIIAAAGAGDRVVTRSYEASPFAGEYAEALAGAELVSPNAELSKEEVLARTPDVVVTFASTAVSHADLEAFGIQQLVTRGYCADAKGSFEDVFDDIALYGKLFGTADKANAEVESLRARVAAVAAESDEHAHHRTAATLILSKDGSTLKAYGAASTSHHQMEALGLENVYGDRPERLIEVSAEELIARNPDVIILLLQGEQTPDDTSAALSARNGLAGVAAIRENRIIAIPFGYSGPSPVAVEGLEVLHEQLDSAH